MKCPGQDTQHWKPGDIFETSCPNCGKRIEFFKDDATRRCKGCGERIANPRLDQGCAETCPAAEQCRAEIRRAGENREDQPQDASIDAGRHGHDG